MNTYFPALDDSARLWIWVAQRPLSESEQVAVTDAVDQFLGGWTSHKRKIRGASAVLLDQVLILAGEIEEGEISGCGIDKSAHLLEEVASRQGFTWSSALDVPIVDDARGRVVMLDRTELKRRIGNGEVSDGTLIIDRTLTSLGDLRSHGLKRPAQDSWAARYFRSHATPAS